jgi:N-acetylmuramoyl-L-alanine amidase
VTYPWLTDPQQVLARTIWGENRGGGWSGMQSVANVVMNRARRGGWWGATPLAVCLHPWQFSTWNALTAHQAQDANFLATVAAGPASPRFQDATTLAALALAGKLPDITGGADSYYAISLDTPPAWAATATHTADIAGQRFYRTAA